MALQRLLILLFAVSTNVSASPVASPPPYDLQQGRRDAVDDDGSPTLSSTVKSPPILPVVTKITASYETTLVLNPRYSLPIPTQVAVVVPGEAAKGCTTTYTPPFLGTAACQWSGTLTVFPATTIQYRQLDCNGCDTLFISDYWYFCPNMSINKTERVNTPSTFWSTICRPTPGYVRRDEGAQNDAPATATSKDNGVVATAKPVSNHLTTAFPTPSALPGGVGDLRIREGNQAEACSTTHVVQPEQSAGKTSTKYSRTTTSTALLNCGGCPLVVSTAVQGYGPPVVFTTTTTLPVVTVTAYACRP